MRSTLGILLNIHCQGHNSLNSGPILKIGKKLLTRQLMYFGVKLRGFEGFLIPVWFGVGQVQKTEFSSHFKTLKLPVGVGGMFNDSWLHF